MWRLSILISVFVLAQTFARPDKYTDKYDNIDLDEILANKRLLMPIMQCVLGKGNCAPMGKEIKDNLMDALQDGCAKCTEAQEKAAYKTIAHLISNEIDLWKELVDMYDPKRVYVAINEQRAKDHGIILPKY